MAKVTQAEYNKAKAAVESAMKSGQVSKTSEWWYTINTWEKAGTTVSNKWVVTPASSNTISSPTETWWLQTKNTSSAWDIYWDVSKNATTDKPLQFTAKWPQELWDLSVYWEEARKREWMEAGTLSKRNDIIASNLYYEKQWQATQADVEEFLKQQEGFTSASAEDQANTINAITKRLSQITAQKWAEGTEWTEGTSNLDEEWRYDWSKLWEKLNDFNADWTSDKPWYYYDKNTWEYYKAYGYNSWSKELQDEFDRLPDNKKKEVSNMWAQALQEYLKLWTDYKRDTEYLAKQHWLDEDIYENQHRQATIQMEQTLRKAEEWFNNLKQNWQYLGNMWMPWVSATRIEAIGDAITEAKTTLGEIKELEWLKMEAMEMNWDKQVLQYTKQIEDLTYNLTWQTSQEFVDALSKFSAAELEWKLDTIDWVTAFKRELLDQMDANLSWITNQSLAQMQVINQQYQDVADKMFEYAKNKNVVNKDMSTVKWYYVDGNGNAILNDKWEPINVPQNPPLDPIFDKESWRLITFWYAEDGSIAANVQQLWDSSNSPNSRIINLLNNWYSVSEILKAYPDLDPKTVQSLSEIIKPSYNKYWLPTTYQGKSYTAVDESKIQNAIDSMPTEWNWWWCWAYVNKYLENLWFAAGFYWDSLQGKLNTINTLTPKIWSVAVFDYNHITKETWENHWHVGIVIWYNEQTWKLIVQDSNYKSDKQIHVREVDPNDTALKWFFDPTMSIDEYNSWMQQEVWSTDWTSVKWRWASILNSIWPSDKNNATQNTAYWFASRAWKNDEAIRSLEDKFSASWNWWITPEFMKSDDRKQYESYKRDWITAWLRKDSWAAISSSEFESAEKYFPVAWDSKETIKAKQKLREWIIEWLFAQAWNADNGQTYLSLYRNNKLSNYASESNTSSSSSSWPDRLWWWSQSDDWTWSSVTVWWQDRFNS